MSALAGTLNPVALVDGEEEHHRPMADGGLQFFPNQELSWQSLSDEARITFGATVADVEAMGRMDESGYRQFDGPPCPSNNMSRLMAVCMARRAPTRSWSAWFPEGPTGLICDADNCPACAAVRSRWALPDEQVTIALDMSAAGIVGYRKLPDVWLDWALDIARRVPQKIICAALSQQGLYPEPLMPTAGQRWRLAVPVNLRLFVVAKMFQTPLADYGEWIYAAWVGSVSPANLEFYDLVPLGTPPADVQGFESRRAGQGYRGGVWERAACRPDRRMAGRTPIFLPRSYLRTSDEAPLPAGRVLANLEWADAIWPGNNIRALNPAAFSALRASRPTMPALYYTSSRSTRPVNPGDVGSIPYDAINASNPEWFLLKVDGTDPTVLANRISWEFYTGNPADTNRYLLDVVNTDCQDYIIAWLLNELASGDETGAALDNIAGDPRSWQTLTNGWPLWKYAGGQAAWIAGFLTYVGRVHSALGAVHRKVFINHNLLLGETSDDAYWETTWGSVDGLVHEQPLSWSGVVLGDPAWLRAIGKHEETTRRGLFDWWMTYPYTGASSDAAAGEWFLYHLASWLLVYSPGLSLFAAQGRGGDLTGRDTWGGLYPRALGQALGPYEVVGSLYRREFEGATVVVNPTGVTELDLGTGVVIPPYSGRILEKC